MIRLTWLLVLAFSVTSVTAAPTRDLPKISARAWVMMDINSGYVLSSHNEHLPLHPGELTKLMSGYVLFKTLSTNNVALNQAVAIDGTIQASNGNRIFLQAGENVRVDKLLSAMFVHGANDATLGLVHQFADSEKQFVERMNRQARVLGMTRSRFQNATGLPDIEQASTAADLALLAQALITQYPQFQDFFRTKKIRHHGISYFNRNAMLWRDSNTSGLMASPNQVTGYHLVATSNKQDQNLAIIVLGAKNEQRLFEAAQALLEYGRRTYQTNLLYPAHKVLAEVPVSEGSASAVPVGTLDNLYVTLPKGHFSQLQAKLDIEPQLAAPVQQGQDAGNLTLVFRDQVIAEYPLVALEPVKVGNALQKAWGDFRNWLRSDPPAVPTIDNPPATSSGKLEDTPE